MKDVKYNSSNEANLHAVIARLVTNKSPDEARRIVTMLNNTYNAFPNLFTFLTKYLQPMFYFTIFLAICLIFQVSLGAVFVSLLAITGVSFITFLFILMWSSL